MIINFLYKMDEKNKRAITGMVVDDTVAPYEPLKQYALILENQVVLKDGQRIISNYGTQYYGLINSAGKTLYFNMNDYQLTVKTNLTDKVSYATTASLEMLNEVSRATNNFNEEIKLKAVEAGYSLLSSGSYKDNYSFFFRKVTDNSYCQILGGRKPLFVGKDKGQYFLTEDFKKAYRVLKNEIRPVLVSNGYVSSSTDKSNLVFSKFNVFHDGFSYAFGGDNSFKVTYSYDTLTIFKNFIPDSTFRMVNDEKRSELLKDICYGFKRDLKKESKIIKINNLYGMLLDDTTIKFVDNAALATPIDLNYIDIFQAAYSLYNEEALFERLDPTNYYCYFLDNNVYNITNEKLEIKSTPIIDADYTLFIKSFREEAKNEGIVLTSVDKYVKYKKINETRFSLEFVDSGYNATIFTEEQAYSLTKVLNANFKRKEIKAIHSTFTDFPVSKKPIKPLEQKYNDLLDTINKSSIKLNPYSKLDEIKTISDKSAFEFLKCLYPKCVMDAYAIFNMIFNSSPNVKNILIVGATSSCDLQGLAYACEKNNKEVRVWTSETTRWGYTPECELGNMVQFVNRYRLPVSSFPKAILDQIDLIYFGKSFSEDQKLVYLFLLDLINSDSKMYLANTNLCEIGNFADSFYLAASKITPISRKYSNLKPEDYNNLANMEDISFDKAIISNKISYQNILKVDHKNLVDLLKRK